MSSHVISCLDSMSSLLSEVNELQPDGTTFTLELGLEEDLEAEIHHFVKLSRMGNYVQAHEVYDHTLQKHDRLFPIIAEYADMLLEQGCYPRAAGYLRQHIETRSDSLNADEMQLLRLMKAWAEICSEGALRPALVEANRAHDLLRSTPIRWPGDLLGDVQIHLFEIYAKIIIFGLRMSNWVDETWVFCPVLCPTRQAEHGFVQWFCILKQNGMLWEASRILRCILPIMPSLSDHDLRLLLSNHLTLDLSVPELWSVLMLTIHQIHYLLNAALSASLIGDDTREAKELYAMCRAKLELGEQISRLSLTEGSVVWSLQLALEKIIYETVGWMLFPQRTDYRPLSPLLAIVSEAGSRQDFRSQIHARLYLLICSHYTTKTMDWRDLYSILELYEVDCGNLVENVQTWGLFASLALNLDRPINPLDSDRFSLFMPQHAVQAATDLEWSYLLQQRCPLPVAGNLFQLSPFDPSMDDYPLVFDIRLQQIPHSPQWHHILVQLDEKTSKVRSLAGETPSRFGAKKRIRQSTTIPAPAATGGAGKKANHKSTYSDAVSPKETNAHSRSQATLNERTYPYQKGLDEAGEAQQQALEGSSFLSSGDDPRNSIERSNNTGQLAMSMRAPGNDNDRNSYAAFQSLEFTTIKSEADQSLDANAFLEALKALDEELGNFDFIVAFAPIRLIAAGGFLAVNYFKNRATTKDLNYLLQPEWATDEDIQKPLQRAISRVSKNLQISEEWANEKMALYITKETRTHLFRKALKQDIILFRGANLIILAAPIKWALKRKVRWMFSPGQDWRVEIDMSDLLAMLKWHRDRKGSELNREHLRTQSINSFDVVPDAAGMEQIAAAYREQYNEEIFT